MRKNKQAAYVSLSKKAMVFLWVFALNLLIYSNALSQELQVQGQVTSAEDGSDLPGVNVSIKGTSTGTVSDIDGKYKLQVPNENSVLIFSFVGYARKEVPVNGRSQIDVSLAVDTKELSEIVVTALNIERESKGLGFAVQEVQGEELDEARETNFVNSLAGRVAGVNVTNGASGVGSSSRIVIRGESSLNGDNQPLFVVDGVPINNNLISNRTQGNLETDYGNGAAEINPDDVESITVLKGANAAALYGSRAANGVILITTKSGKGKEGIGVSYNSTLTFEDPLRIPKYQNMYGQGGYNDQGEQVFRFVDGSNGGIFDGLDESWGPRLDARDPNTASGFVEIPQHDSPTSNGLRGGDIGPAKASPEERAAFLEQRGTITPTLWRSHPDNIKDFFETGRTWSNNIAVSGSNEKGNFRLSYTNLNSEGILPNTNLLRNTINFNSSYSPIDKLDINANVNYVKSESDNRPNNSYGTENIMYLWVWFGRQIDMNSLRDYWQPGFEDVQQFNYNYNWHDNPYFTMFENTNAFDKDRVFGNISATYHFTDWLRFMIRTGTDFYNDLRVGKRAFSTQRFPQGQYREDKIFFAERNTDFLLTFDKSLNRDFNLTASLGGNRMDQEQRFHLISANQLSIPGVYNFGNSAIPLENNQFNQTKRINSLYGLAQLSYLNMLFLDLTARNDWSSTLPKDNNSYFYPSVSLAGVISDMVTMPNFLSFVKLRAGVAQVGNDTDPYRLRNVFTYGTPWGTTQMVSESNEINNEDLKPEIATSFELGTDIRFFNDQLGFDFTYYNTNSKNQILNIPVPVTSGYGSKWINAGEIETQGIELMVNATPIYSPSGFRWDLNLNYTRNRSKVIELTDEIEDYVISSNYMTVLAKEGGRMGDMYGTGFQEVNGETLFNNGFHVRDNSLRLLGNYNPDWMAGLNNSFSYKGLSLNVLFDFRYGGEVMSRTLLIGGTSGMMEETIPGRDEETGGLPYYFDSEAGRNVVLPSHDAQAPDGSTVFHNGIIGDGVMNVGTDENPEYVKNDVPIPARSFYWSKFNRSNEASGLYDATYLKLREVRLGYTLPNTWLRNLPFSNVKVSVVGRNLALWTENPHFDPELISFDGGNLVPGVEDMALPSTRSIGFNLNVNF